MRLCHVCCKQYYVHLMIINFLSGWCYYFFSNARKSTPQKSSMMKSSSLLSPSSSRHGRVVRGMPVLCSFLLFLSGCHSWVVQHAVPTVSFSVPVVRRRTPSRRTVPPQRSTMQPGTSSSSSSSSFLGAVTEGSNNIQTVDLTSMDDDHEQEGQLMAESIIAWLDDEWIPQQVHIDMAARAKASYIECRQNQQQHDVMDVMMQISQDLQDHWSQYNDDAFINAWDIGNYCSDYLIQRSGHEGCACSTELS